MASSKSADDSWPGQLIHQAAIYNNVELLQCLLQGEEKTFINAQDVCGRTALYTAVSNGSLQCLRLLLEHGADMNIAAGPRCHHMTPLHEAVLDCKLDALTLLLSHGADLSVRDAQGKTPEQLAKYLKNRDETLIFERENERRTSLLDQMSRELCAACAQGQVSDVETVLDGCGQYRKEVINKVTKGLSPLAIACKCGYTDIVQLLLSEGAALTSQKDTGLSMLHLACESGNTDVILILLEAFPDLIFTRSVEHQLPLHSAVISNKANVVQFLLDYPYQAVNMLNFIDEASGLTYTAGIEVNAQDASGDTPLHIACRNGYLDIVQLLLSFSVQVRVEKKAMPHSASLRSRLGDHEEEDDGSPEEDEGSINRDSLEQDEEQNSNSERGQRQNQMHFRIIYPVNSGILCSQGFSPLHLSIQHRHTEVLKLLLESRTLTTNMMRLKDAEVPIVLFAYERGGTTAMEMLLRHGVEDVDNRTLKTVIAAQDHEAIWLLLTHKSSRDLNHSVNKTEMRRLAYQISQLKMDRLDRASSLDPDYRARYPTTAVAISWEGLEFLEGVERSCLVQASLLHNQQLNHLTDALLCLCAITKVDISKNNFTTFPTILLELPSLVLLRASSNKISDIPEHSNVLCCSLEELHLNNNNIKTLPKYIFQQLPLLKFLDVSMNKLVEMPAEMWMSPSLISLNLSNNLLSWLPTVSRDVVGHSGQQSHEGSLRTGRISVSSIQRETGHSTSSSVSSLDVDTHLPDLSSDRVEFTILSPQNLTTNPIVRVNKWSAGVTIVNRDPWKGNNQQVSGLQQLWLTKNKFTQVPPCLVCCAPALQVLTLSENPLTSVGAICDYPPFLVELDLTKTTLTNLDPWKASLDVPPDVPCFGPQNQSTSSRYSSISVSNPNSPLSPVHARSSSFSSLGQHQQSQHFLHHSHSSASTHNTGSPSHMMLRDLLPCSHRNHTSLPRLEKLSLAFNQLGSLVLARDAKKDNKGLDTQSICSMESEEIQSRLLFPNLCELNVSANQLSSVPSDIGEQSALKILSLRGNSKLRELPPKLGLLKNLWKLDLELCPLDGAIQDFLQNSRFPVKDILGFLQSVLEESTEYNCMNLMIVGFHKIGKTSLLQKLCEKGRVNQKASHWRDRVNKELSKKSRSTQLSTVGIDINELILEKRTKGPVIFRTWDFGGQREYYATHQYFLSPRSLYLVVWSIIDGERGVESLLQWLINIQARAPGASVIIVGTHLDILRDKATKKNYPEDYEESMTALVKKMFMSNSEPDKSGLPSIHMAINVSCKTGENIRRLVDVIYDHVFELKHPRSRTQFLVKQKIPRKYLLLQNIIRELAAERIKAGKEPVLIRSKYTLCVQNKMMEQGITFRDVEELEQATRFLHENGVLFHYDDLALRDLFFLDPQWLCDQLARVITVKEINNFAQRGVMQISNLEFLFKSNTHQLQHICSYITSLLNKFEVALQFDRDHLLLPSLLPTETELLEMARRKSDVRIPLRKPFEASVGLSNPSSHIQVGGLHLHRRIVRSRRSDRHVVEDQPPILHVGESIFYTGSQTIREPMTASAFRESGRLLLLAIKPTSNPIFSYCRLYFLTYFPSGFWPRLITRVLADSSLYPIVKQLFNLPKDLLRRSPEVKTLSDKDPEWRCWQTGFELFYMGFEMLRIREVFFSTSSYFCDYSRCRIKCSIDSEWQFLDVLNSKILEITFPTDSLKFHVANKDGPPLQNLDQSRPASTVYREEVATTKLLVKIIEHVDNLLQDWYPDLGELRFTQNCEGRYLVTRVVPCPQCLNQEVVRQRKDQRDENAWFFLNPDVPDLCMSVVVMDEDDSNTGQRQRSATSIDGAGMNGGRGLGSPVKTRPRTFTEGQAYIYNRDTTDTESVIFTWLIERCMLDTLEGVNAVCPLHGSISPLYLLGRDGSTHQQFIAPDVMFQDQCQDLLLPSSSQLEIGRSLGKGNFGEVHEGLLHHQDGLPSEKVAVKIFFKQAQARTDISRGLQGFLEPACAAYLTVRQEISILSELEHPNIVPLIAMNLQPLSLLLMLAPHGALFSKLEQLNSQGECLPLFVIRQLVLQVARAVTYLHSHNIIYRDLKSENVLIWELPSSADAHPNSRVEVRLADYGISRAALPSGTRGFGGTPRFIAPEILQHAGKGTYTDKVDVFSFGMFLFEILTCHLPFADVNNPNNLICQGERPSLTVQEAERCPSYILDLMTLCWSQEPDDRPSMEAVLGVAGSAQFCHLEDVVSLGPEVTIYCGCSLSHEHFVAASGSNAASPTTSDMSSVLHGNPAPASSQIWLSSGFHDNNSIEIFTFNHARRVENYKTLCLSGPAITTMCVFDGLVWCVDVQGLIQMFHCETLGLVHQLHLPVPTTSLERSSIIALHPLPGNGSRNVIAVSADGALYLCEQPLRGPLVEESSPTIYRVEKCFSSVLVSTASRCELWLGQSKGAICVWNTITRSMEFCLSHGRKIAANSTACMFLVTQSGATGNGDGCKYVWSYNFPGSVICMWDSHRRQILERLDCSQIVSTVDSPVMAFSENFDCGQVSALNVIDSYLYVGTTRGSVLVTDAVSLSPLCVFQCHSSRDFYVKTILPVLPSVDPDDEVKVTGMKVEGQGRRDEEEEEAEEERRRRCPAVVTVGKGYVNVLKTFHSTLDSPNTSATEDSSGRGEPVTAPPVDLFHNHTFLLSWRAEDWEFY